MTESSRRFKDTPLDDNDPVERALRAASAEAPATRRGSLGGSGNFLTRASMETSRSLQEQINELRAQIASGNLLLTLDPKSIVHSDFANRHDLSLRADDTDLAALRDSIRKHGQERPICVRPLAKPQGEAKYELVEGHRRHAACLMLDAEVEGGWPIKALIDGSLADSKALVLRMFRENDERLQLSAYETGLQWKSWLTGGLFRTHAEIAKDTGKSDATVFKYIQIAELPPTVLAAFRDPRVISLRWGTELAKAYKLKPGAVEAAAERLLSMSDLTGEQVFRALIAAATDRKPASPSREEAVKVQGKVAFRIATRAGRLMLRFAPSISKEDQKEICEAIRELVESSLKAGKAKP
jgi:ParB family chromosome partitioning protein